MSGEVGEFCNMWEKHYSQGHNFCDIEEKMKLELGDILWYLTLACEALGVGLFDVANSNIAKLEARYKNSDGSVDFSPEKSEERRDAHGKQKQN
jgi:NTP pyrophosphatase (non-canonical NTP hydrolase)